MMLNGLRNKALEEKILRPKPLTCSDIPVPSVGQDTLSLSQSDRLKRHSVHDDDNAENKAPLTSELIPHISTYPVNPI